MNFNNHSNLEGQHAFLGASKYHWINYSEDKVADAYSKFLATQKGTVLHAFAAQCISLGQKLPKSQKTLNMYVNDAIGYKMTPEQTLFYSENCFGTADSISYRSGLLRIHDLKTGIIPAHMEQLMIYAALFCLEDVHLCDTVGVEFPKLNVSATAKCIKTIYDAISNKYASIELGESRTNLASTISDQKQAISDTITKTFMQQAIENATQLISGGLGGFVIMHSSTGGKYPDEILIMDTDDIATAKKVWRWNKGGLGYSSTGYNGPFALAMTQDGQIVADFVKTGTMSANRINGGTLILGGRNNSNGTALIKDADGNVLIRLDRDGITLSEDVQISYENISDAPSIPTKVSELTNDSKYTTMSDVEKKGYQTKANVTKITKDTVTTTYVNALDITAKQVNCKSGSKEANINAGASHYKYSDEYIGEIGTNGWTGDDNRRGLVFDLDENGDYMTWAAQPKSGQNYLVKLLYERNGYNSKGVTYDADTINLGCDIDMHYYKLKNVSWENGGGITGTMRFVQVGGMNSDGTVSNWSNNAYLQFERGVLIKAGWYDY